MKLTVDIVATDGRARTGTVTTARGSFRTPVFMPVGTRGTIRTLTTAQVQGLGAEIVLGNTYHLMLRPGAETVAALGGLGRFTGWSSHTLTDSGGFQVFSLQPTVDDDGVTFRSTYDGSSVRLTPESAVRTQELIGADIQMVLDVCTALPADTDTVRAALELTASWAARAKAAHTRRNDQALFGISQGGVDPALRELSARRTVELDFDGYAIGGLSVGETRAEMAEALDAAIAHLPVDQPRYVMGLGDPLGVIDAIGAGVDMMDCVLPTRLARHGTVLTHAGRVNVKRAEFARSDEPLDSRCACDVCARHSRGYIRHLLTLGEPSGAALCSLHNISWLFDLVEAARQAIARGSLASLRAEVATVWHQG